MRIDFKTHSIKPLCRSVIPDVEMEISSNLSLTGPQYLNLSSLEPDSSRLQAKSYTVGVIFGLIGAASRAGHYVTCKIIFEKNSTSTNWIILFAGFGGFLVSLLSSFMDPEHLLLSARLVEISGRNWIGQIAGYT